MIKENFVSAEKRKKKYNLSVSNISNHKQIVWKFCNQQARSVFLQIFLLWT